VNKLLDFSFVSDSKSASKAFDRQPDRRSANRRDSAGRRRTKRYILENDIVVTIELPGQARVSGDVLDLSLSGAYLLVGDDNIPQTGQNATISFPDYFKFEGLEAVEATVMYVNSSSLFGEQMHGLGIQFIQEFPRSIVEESSDNIIYFAGKRLFVTR